MTWPLQEEEEEAAEVVVVVVVVVVSDFLYRPPLFLTLFPAGGPK